MFFYINFALLLLINIALCQNIKSSSNGSSLDSGEDTYYAYPDWSDPFDWQVLKAISNIKFKNVIVSPISLKLVLALLYEGSSGATEKEFQKVLGFPTDKKLVSEHFARILETLPPSAKKEFALNLGSKIFMDSQIRPQPKYAAKIKQDYKTDIESLNFSNSVASAGVMNQWVQNVTEGKISNLVNPSDLESSIMVIANAIFFKGNWRHQFPKNRTANGGFYINPKEIVNVPFMRTTDNFYFHESTELDAKILRLPYKGKKYALFMVLPNSKGGLPDLLHKLNLQTLKKNLYFLDEVPVDVILPKLDFEFKIKMNKILEEFGLTQMFQNTASFPGIAKGNSGDLRMLYVSDIIQKSGIQLDEEGSTIVSATDVTVINKFGDVENTFNASHPFMFFLEEQTTGTILFTGKVENPLEESLTNRISDSGIPASFAVPNEVKDSEPLNLDLEPEHPENDVLVQRFNYFDLELLEEFSESESNIFVSPASIKSTLAMIFEGARGKCAEEIGNALRIDNIDEEGIRRQLKQLLVDLSEKTENTEIITANAVFVSNKLKLLNEYKQTVASQYNALVEVLDFTNSVKAVEHINSWANNYSRGKIKEIIGQNMLFDGSLLITNALYFKSKWKTSFPEKETTLKCFNTVKKQCVMTPIMRTSGSFNYSLITSLNAHAIDLPYEDDKYSMLLLIPFVGNNIKILARDLLHANFERIVSAMKPTDIILELPKFGIESDISLIHYLKPLKISEIFGNKANLTGIVKDTNVRIGNIIHKTKIEVDESGTQASAISTAYVIPLMGESSLKISADKPFIFFIYQKLSKNLLFEGIFIEPEVPAAPSPKPLKASRTFGPEMRRVPILTNRASDSDPLYYERNQRFYY